MTHASGPSSTSTPRQKAVLVGVLLPGMTEVENEASLGELERLVTTLGFDPVARLSQRRPSLAGGLVLGDGRLKDLAKMTGGTGEVGPRAIRKATKAELRREKEKEQAEAADEEATVGVPFSAWDADENDETAEGDANGEADDDQTADSDSPDPQVKADVVVFDCELSPSQLANLQKATGVEVLDRTGVIVEIFSRHARTREARIQVEIARLAYLSPRLRETGGGGDRGGGGGIGGRGSGETALELDRRRIRDRIAELRAELVDVQREDHARRQRRTEQATVALVGYTNAGKSSLMRALTGSEVLVADKLFATLDTTVRALAPESVPRVLVSDTVGFIKRLPHDLVASFRSTLEEARNASLLLFVVDAADPSFRSQLETTKHVLGEIGVDDIPSRLILNKADKLDDSLRTLLKQEFPDGIFLSTRNKDDVSALRETIVAFFETDHETVSLLLPYDKPHLVGEVRRTMRVVGESYDENGVTFQVVAKRTFLESFCEKNGVTPVSLHSEP
ncbi:MAG: GTPase HflX [Silvanigrellales bacterium]|jgi:GTP-binding protein HflX|nr:GTPase HflX [Silvanigrellales bacterium]